MNMTFIQVPQFVKLWRDHFELEDTDLRQLEKQLAEAPHSGKVIPGCGGVRKVRFAPARYQTGKSGGFRIAYIYMPAQAVIILLVMYAKTDQANLTPSQQAAIRKLADTVRDSVLRSFPS